MIKIVDLHKSFGPKPGPPRASTSRSDAARRWSSSARAAPGKSVLLKHLIGILKPDTGEIWIDGLEITRLGDEDDPQDHPEVRDALPGRGPLRFDDRGRERRLRPRAAHGPLAGRGPARSWPRAWSGSGCRGIEGLMPYELSRRHEEAGRPGPGHRLPARDHPLRRAVDRARPHPGGRHQRPHHPD